MASFWDTKGKTNPGDVPQAKQDPKIAKESEEALRIAKQAEEMKKMTEMALAAMDASTKSSGDALEGAQATLEKVKVEQEEIVGRR